MKLRHRYLIAIFLFANHTLANSARFEGRVVAISDGDTVTLLDSSKHQHKIRLAGIDAPEKKQPFGQRSKQNLSELVFNKDVEADCVKVDRYKREVCKITVNGTDANLEQVKAGLAWWYRSYAKDQSKVDRAAYAAAEQEAKDGKRGLWGDAEATAPWEWRKISAH